jgi:molybdopterin converting factor small subunit
MPSIRIPTPLRTYTKGHSEITLSGSTVSEAMDDLLVQYPDMKQHVFNEEGTLRPFINLFLDEDNINDLQGLETPLGETDRLMMLPSIAGGSSQIYQD